ncbi:MAG: T9SS type A sorting domain-containing protein [Bacteroidota bacterium]
MNRCVAFLLGVGLLALLAPSSPAQVRNHVKVTENQGGFTGDLDPIDWFGRATARIADLDGDGIQELAVGAMRDDDGGLDRGALYILFLHRDGTVRRYQKLSDTEGNFGAELRDEDRFGYAIADIGDIDLDGVSDIAVGSYWDDDGCPPSNLDCRMGAIYILLLNADGTMKSCAKISATSGGFEGDLGIKDWFGRSVESVGDLDGDGVQDLAVGADRDDDGGHNKGAVYLLFLNRDLTVKRHVKISATQGLVDGGGPPIDYEAGFGYEITTIGDFNRDGVQDIAVGAPFSDDGGRRHGAVWLLALTRDGQVRDYRKISALEGNLGLTFHEAAWFGYEVDAMSDLNGDGTPDLAVSAAKEDFGGESRGAAYLVFLTPEGTVLATQRIGQDAGGFTGELSNNDYFGRSMAALGDLDGDGTPDLVVAADKDDDSGNNSGAVWMLFLDRTAFVPDLEATPTQVDFGVLGPTERKRRIVILKNEHATKLKVEALTIEQQLPSFYRLVNPPPLPLILSQGAHLRLTVETVGTVPGRHDAVLAAATSDPLHPVLQVPLDSRVEPPVLSLLAPNPASASSLLTLTLDQEDHLDVRVLDILGRTVWQASSHSYAAGTHRIPLDLSGLAAGTYFVRVEGEVTRQQQQLRVVR